MHDREFIPGSCILFLYYDKSPDSISTYPKIFRVIHQIFIYRKFDDSIRNITTKGGLIPASIIVLLSKVWEREIAADFTLFIEEINELTNFTYKVVTSRPKRACQLRPARLGELPQFLPHPTLTAATDWVGILGSFPEKKQQKF